MCIEEKGLVYYDVIMMSYYDVRAHDYKDQTISHHNSYSHTRSSISNPLDQSSLRDMCLCVSVYLSV